MQDRTITTNPDLIVSDISNETYREYTYFDGKITYTTRINAPANLVYKKSNSNTFGGISHRVIDSVGTVHYLPAGWLKLTWKVKDGAPKVDF